MQALRGPAEQGSLEAIAALCGSLEARDEHLLQAAVFLLSIIE